MSVDNLCLDVGQHVIGDVTIVGLQCSCCTGWMVAAGVPADMRLCRVGCYCFSFRRFFLKTCPFITLDDEHFA